MVEVTLLPESRPDDDSSHTPTKEAPIYSYDYKIHAQVRSNKRPWLSALRATPIPARR